MGHEVNIKQMFLSLCRSDQRMFVYLSSLWFQSVNDERKGGGDMMNDSE